MVRFSPASCQQSTWPIATMQGRANKLLSLQQHQKQPDWCVSTATAAHSSHLRCGHSSSLLDPVQQGCKTQVHQKRQGRKGWRGRIPLGEKGFKIGRSPLLWGGTLWHKPSRDVAAGMAGRQGLLCRGCHRTGLQSREGRQWCEGGLWEGKGTGVKGSTVLRGFQVEPQFVARDTSPLGPYLVSYLAEIWNFCT